MCVRKKTLAALFLTAFFSLGHSTPSFAVDFASSVGYPVGSSPTGIVVADFNGDRRPDIAVANFGSGNISILLGNGDGTFQAAVNFDAGMANNGAPLSVAVGDFNGDGKPDLAVASTSAVTLFLGKGDGTFQSGPTATIAGAFVVQQVQVADLNPERDVNCADSVRVSSRASLEQQ